MNAQASELLRVLASEVAGVLVLRTLPFLGWSLFSRRVAYPEKLLALLLYGSLALLAASTRGQFVAVLREVALGALYFTLCATLLVGFTRRRACAALPRPVVLGLLCVVFLAVPALSFTGPLGAAVVLAGWELTFAAYSYVVETRAPAPRRTLGEGLFFLLVNPVLCYPERGAWRKPEDERPNGVARCIAGALLVALATTLLIFAPHLRSVAAASTLGGYGAFVGKQGAGIVRVYFTQAGVAHVQLGLLSLMGYRAPERYLSPLLAHSPADFWRRWNIYIGSWFRRYVFTPVCYRLARRRLSPHVRTSVAVLLTFLATGVAHDLILLAQVGRVGPGTVAFLVQGVLLLAFEAASRRRLLGRRPDSLVARLVFCHVLLVLAWSLAPAPS